MRTAKLNQRGAGGIGCLFMVALAAAGIYAGLELGLPELRNRSFEDRLNESYAFFQRQPQKYIHARIIQIASEFHIDLKPEQVKVEIEGDRLTIDIAYEKVADLKFQKKVLAYHIHRSGPY
ncbi:MAG TPA: hypothetical protein VN317_10405 [Candidatus Methanoperedens sp.]|nr:hypothetical protein [Candidatus Methanoperedens sp.]